MASQTLEEMATEVNAAVAEHEAAPHQSHAEAGGQQPWSPHLVMGLSAGFLAFGLIICVIMTVLLAKKCQANDVLRAFSLPLIIVSAVFLVVTGYSDQQISSVIGLLGAIAGYILGARDRTEQRRETKEIVTKDDPTLAAGGQ